MHIIIHWTITIHVLKDTQNANIYIRMGFLFGKPLLLFEQNGTKFQVLSWILNQQTFLKSQRYNAVLKNVTFYKILKYHFVCMRC